MKVFEINECEWYAGEDAESCIKLAMEESGLTREDVCDGNEDTKSMELSEEAMDRLHFIDEDEAGNTTKRTFAEQLQLMIERGETFPAFFATTEF